MAKVFAQIDERNAEFIRAQHVMFVATAPLAAEGLVNLSPKGLDTFVILDPHTVAYLDLVGSGVETIAHLRENGRIVLMFCAFEGPPRILRLHGRGDAVEPGDPEWDELRRHFGEFASDRAVVRVRLDRISDSCGYGVPRYRFEAERSQLLDWAARKGPEGVADYKRDNNRASLDDLPGLRNV